MITFDDANQLLNDATDFLLSCGGVYQNVTMGLQSRLMFCIISGQYVLTRNEYGDITHFLIYWKVNRKDIECIREGMQPINRVSGSVLFIVDHGNKEGRKGMTSIIKELRHRAKGMQGVFWNSKGRGIKEFMNQKGD